LAIENRNEERLDRNLHHGLDQRAAQLTVARDQGVLAI
jgi:hypothetical protein